MNKLTDSEALRYYDLLAEFDSLCTVKVAEAGSNHARLIKLREIITPISQTTVTAQETCALIETGIAQLKALTPL